MSGFKDEYLVNSLLPKPTRDGYYFWGWSETPVPYKGTEPIRFATASSTTLYAVWTSDENEDPRIDPPDGSGEQNPGDETPGTTPGGDEPAKPAKKGCGGCKSVASVGGIGGVIAIAALAAFVLLVPKKKKQNKVK